MKHILSSMVMVLVATAAAVFTTSCNNKKFQVKGNIEGAKDSMLYLENLSLDGPVAIDSAKLDEQGTFSFSVDAPTAPEFYRLRIAGQIINVCADSTETVTIKAQWPGMATNYQVEGSEECSIIRELSLKQIDLQAKVIAIQSNYNLNDQVAADSIMALVDAYKKEVKLNYIFKAPMRASSYFALFQAIGNTLLFNPQVSEDDIKVFAAVATSWDTYHPDALRGQNLHNIAIEGMKNIRIMRNKLANTNVDASKVHVSGLIDISLMDNRGNVRNLSDLKGKVVMLDFHVFGTKESTQRIMQMRELYNKYHDRGFEIYQVSFNDDEHFWKTQTEALPWISVRDADGGNSQNLVAYNVNTLPTFFLIDRNNVLQKRDAQIKDIDKEIQSLLAQ
ncbi:MAG: TlpA disulfide reductase family protein [Prevotella sp.]|nr:TlpA disulfide reductase family protein [Bacteroidales bacterium]MDY2692145.1 TlpA disulfide reductase family protein [Prevotella sp.]